MEKTKIRRKMWKQNKGITLIALVITIIVILILAGVAISTLMGKNGLINRTISAKEKTENAGTLENVQLAVAASMANENYAVNEDDLKLALTAAFGAEGTGYAIDGDSSSGWTITVGDVSYKASASGEVKEYVPPVEIATLINTTNQNENPYADKTKEVKDTSIPAQTFWIPEGFKLASDTATTVDEGIVVEDGEGNQFVWVPVPDAIETTPKSTDSVDLATATAENKYTPMATTYEYNGKTYYRGMLYSFSGTTSTYKSGYNVGTTDHSEPRLVTGNSSDAYAPMESSSIRGSDYDANSSYVTDILGYNKTDDKENASDFGKQMQKDYDDMVESVAKYGGFYVGRYETGIETITAENETTTEKIVSKNAYTNENVTTADSTKTKTNTWYGLYKEQRNFATTGSIRSSMIWGSQYDAMMNWMAKTGKTVGSSTPMEGTSRNNSDVTGNSSYNDVINKVYDLYGCHREWTLEACYADTRARRGGVSGNSYSPANRTYSSGDPSLAYSINGSRLTLYIM